MKQTSIYTAALMLILAACSDQQYDNDRTPGQQPGASGPFITVTATQGDRPQTRLGYVDPNDPTQPIAVTWAAEDKFYVGKDFSAFTGETSSLSVATAYFSPFTLKEGGAGSKNAEFEGNAPTGTQNDDPLYAIYGDGAGRIALNEEGTLSFDYTKQRQTANGDKTHLSATDFMVATTTYKTDKQPVFAFTHLGAMMKFTLTLPTEGLTVKELTLTSIDSSKPFSDVAQWDKVEALAFSKSKAASASTTLLLGQEGTEAGITLTDTKLTAYMMVAPTTLTKDAALIAGKTLELKVTDVNGSIYTAYMKGADIEQGKYYTVEAAMEASDEMNFTIRVDSDYPSFRIPFSRASAFTTKITVKWGDGDLTVIDAVGSTPGKEFNSLTHTYATAGDYTITISSAETDATKIQMPNFCCEQFESYAKKIISINTPMLKVETFYQCFSRCINLVSVPSDLLKKNTHVKSFSECFQMCKKLKEIPCGLFNENTQVLLFNSCFFRCESLTELPQGLFDKNTLATNFSACFQGCTALTELPQDLFDKNTLVTDISTCFQNCAALAKLPDNLFGNHVKVETFQNTFKGCTSLKELPNSLFKNNKTVESFDCTFQNCTSLEKLPSDLFKGNTNVDGFYGIFQGCTSLKELPSDLFDGNAETRFFSRCFSGCTSLTSLPKVLFDKNTEADSFYQCFLGCTSLTSLPEGLFDKNKDVTSFQACFQDCSNLVLNEKIFCSAETFEERNNYFKAYTFDKLTFENCFYNAGSALTPEQKATSVAPELWMYTYSGTTTKTDCFTGCKASNLKVNPSWTWGAPAN